MGNKTIKLNVTVDHKRFYNADSMWGVYGMIPNTNKEEIETIDHNGVFAVTGNTPELTIGEKYDIEISPTYNKKYGKGYEFVMVAAKRPETAEEQREYVQMMVTEKQFEEIIKVYPNEPIIDLMENDEFDYSEMKGIGKVAYNRIKQNIFNNMEIQEALVELKDLDITFNSLKKLVEHFGSAQSVVQRVNNNIYELCEVSGFGFKKIDEYAMNRGDDPTNTGRIVAAVNHILKQDNDRGHSWIGIKEAKKELVKLLEIDDRYIEDIIEEIVEYDKRVYKDENRLALDVNVVYEKKFYNRIMEMSGRPSNTQVDNIEEKISNLEREKSFKLTSEQKEAIIKAVNNNILIINGKGGTGKSTILQFVTSILEEYSYMSCALSGRAAKVLQENNLKSKTIHKMLMETISFESGEVTPLKYDIIIVDEASMVDNYLFYRVADSLKDGAKLIVVGDNGQLPPIGAGANFSNLILYAGDKIPRQELTIVHRQAQKSGILSTANKIREGEQINSPYSEETEVFGELEDMVLIPTDKETDIKQIVLDIAERNKGRDIAEFQVITGRVDSGDISVKNLNIEMQKIFNDVSKPSVPRSGYEYRIGDKIIQNGNNYEAKIAIDERFYSVEDLIEKGKEVTEVLNGTIGKIVNIKFDNDKTRKDHKIHIKFEDVEDVVEYSVHELQQISLAYAITVHKFQGSGVDYLVFVFDGASFMLLSKEFVYTGLTRAKKAAIMVAENHSLHMAIKKSLGNNRRTFLKDFLLEG